MTVSKKTIITFVFLLLTAVLLLGATLTVAGDKVFAGIRPTNLGVNLGHAVTALPNLRGDLANPRGHLAPCPSTHNCVNSQSADSTHQIEPLSYNSSPQEAFAHLKKVIATFNRAKIIAETDNYIYAEFTLPIVGFVDDVEFQLDEKAKVINVRSTSRLGESDLGVNRQRVESIRNKFAQLQVS